jgi:hypothetical protein
VVGSQWNFLLLSSVTDVGCIRTMILRALVLSIFLWDPVTEFRLYGAEDLLKSQFVHPRVYFDGFVNWKFHHRQKLKSWKTTALVIEQTLKFWYPQSTSCLLVENGSPGIFRRFLHFLPREQSCDVSIVYLASHQSSAGEWDFTQKEVILLNSIIGETKIPTHSRRIVILDACFAAAVLRQAPWRQKLALISLLASSASEETPEVNFHSPQPVDFASRYPVAFAWLRDCLGKEWDGKISFLGFIWVQSFLMVKDCPANMRDWIDFLHRCELSAKDFRENVDRESSSEITSIVDGEQRPR